MLTWIDYFWIESKLPFACEMSCCLCPEGNIDWRILEDIGEGAFHHVGSQIALAVFKLGIDVEEIARTIKDDVREDLVWNFKMDETKNVFCFDNSVDNNAHYRIESESFMKAFVWLMFFQ